MSSSRSYILFIYLISFPFSSIPMLHLFSFCSHKHFSIKLSLSPFSLCNSHSFFLFASNHSFSFSAKISPSLLLFYSLPLLLSPLFFLLYIYPVFFLIVFSCFFPSFLRQIFCFHLVSSYSSILNLFFQSPETHSSFCCITQFLSIFAPLPYLYSFNKLIHLLTPSLTTHLITFEFSSKVKKLNENGAIFDSMPRKKAKNYLYSKR